MCVRCGQIRSFRGCWVPHPIINYFFNLVVLYTFYSYIERLIPMPTTVPPENMGQNNKWDFLKSLWNSIWALNELSRSDKFYTWNLKTWKLNWKLENVKTQILLNFHVRSSILLEFSLIILKWASIFHWFWNQKRVTLTVWMMTKLGMKVPWHL